MTLRAEELRGIIKLISMFRSRKKINFIWIGVTILATISMIAFTILPILTLQ